MIDVRRGEYSSWEAQKWAEPNIAQAAEFTKLIYSNREYSSELGHKVREAMLGHLSAAQISREM